MQGRSPLWLKSITVLAAAAAILVPASAANASLLATTTNCAPQPLSLPFSLWGDVNQYTPIPDGGLENGAGEWSLGAGSEIVSGNEPFFLRNPADSHSLKVGSGSTATSGTMCIGQEHPSMRFVAKNLGGRGSILWVQAAIETSRGRELSIPIGIERGNAEWEPSYEMQLLVNYLNLAPGTYTPVEFSFSARGGDWLIDDVFVDPRKH